MAQKNIDMNKTFAKHPILPPLTLTKIEHFFKGL